MKDINEKLITGEVEEEAAIGNLYVHIFKVPFEYMGKKYDALTFDWDSLTGQDGLSIQAELTALGKSAPIPALSAEYQIRVAAKACTEKIGSDAFGLISLRDFNKITNAARNFLLL
jgi:hypothetical protein